MALMQCPSCHGYGGETIRILDDGSGPWEECGFCNSTGKVSRKQFFIVLGYVSAEKRQTKRNSERRMAEYREQLNRQI